MAGAFCVKGDVYEKLKHKMRGKYGIIRMPAGRRA